MKQINVKVEGLEKEFASMQKDLISLYSNINSLSLEDLLLLENKLKGLEKVFSDIRKSISSLAITKMQLMNVDVYETEKFIFKLVQRTNTSYDYNKVWETLAKHGFTKKDFVKEVKTVQYITAKEKKNNK